MILSAINNSGEFLNDLASKTRSLSSIVLVDICKSSIENSLFKNDFNDILVFIRSNSSLLSLITNSGLNVLTLIDKFLRFSKNLTLFNSKFTFLLIFKTSVLILSLNFLVLIPKKLNYAIIIIVIMIKNNKNLINFLIILFI